MFRRSKYMPFMSHTRLIWIKCATTSHTRTTRPHYMMKAIRLHCRYLIYYMYKLLKQRNIAASTTSICCHSSNWCCWLHIIVNTFIILLRYNKKMKICDMSRLWYILWTKDDTWASFNDSVSFFTCSQCLISNEKFSEKFHTPFRSYIIFFVGVRVCDCLSLQTQDMTFKWRRSITSRHTINKCNIFVFVSFSSLLLNWTCLCNIIQYSCLEQMQRER